MGIGDQCGEEGVGRCGMRVAHERLSGPKMTPSDESRTSEKRHAMSCHALPCHTAHPRTHAGLCSALHCKSAQTLKITFGTRSLEEPTEKNAIILWYRALHLHFFESHETTSFFPLPADPSPFPTSSSQSSARSRLPLHTPSAISHHCTMASPAWVNILEF
jgi:hypothetical protein